MIKVYCVICGKKLKQINYEGNKIRVCPCTNPGCNSNELLEQSGKTNSELLAELDRAVPLSRRQAVYLAFNTAIVDKLLALLEQGKTEAVKIILTDIEH